MVTTIDAYARASTRYDTFLLLGMRYQHISNAFIQGRDRNPVMNGWGGYGGVMFTF